MVFEDKPCVLLLLFCCCFLKRRIEKMGGGEVGGCFCVASLSRTGEVLMFAFWFSVLEEVNMTGLDWMLVDICLSVCLVLCPFLCVCLPGSFCTDCRDRLNRSHLCFLEFEICLRFSVWLFLCTYGSSSSPCAECCSPYS